MKLVPFTVMVPAHYAAFMQEMDKILTNHSYEYLTSMAENTVNGSGEAVEQVCGWDFDTEKERHAAFEAIEAACDRLRQADADLSAAEVKV